MSYNDCNLFSNDTIRVNIRTFNVLFKYGFQHDSILEITSGVNTQKQAVNNNIFLTET